MNTYNQKKTNLFTGFIGAVLGAAIGAAIWMLVARADIVSAYVGLLIAVFSGYGYDLFRGPKTNAKVFVLIICVVLAVVAGTYGDLCWELHDFYESQYGVLVDMGVSPNSTALSIPTESEYIQSKLQLPENKEVITGNLSKGLAFAALGCAGIIIGTFKSRKKQKAEEEAALAAQAQAEYEQSMYAAGYTAAPAYDPNAYAEPTDAAVGYAIKDDIVGFDENGYPVRRTETAYAAAPAEYAAPAAHAYTAPAAPAYSEPAYTAPAAPAYSEPAYTAPAAARPAADDGYSAEYKFTSMRTAVSSKPAAPAPSSAKKNPFVKPEFSNSFNTGKATPAKSADSGSSSKTFYSDK